MPPVHGCVGGWPVLDAHRPLNMTCSTSSAPMINMVPPLPNVIRPSIIRSLCGHGLSCSAVPDGHSRERWHPLSEGWGPSHWDHCGQGYNSKNPPSHIPSPTTLPTDPSTPVFIDLDITANTVEWIAQWLYGSTGVWGAMLMLSHIGSQGMVKPARSCMLLLLAFFAHWLANDFPPCAAYQALMTSHLLALDKNLGVHCICISDTWPWVLAKCIL